MNKNPQHIAIIMDGNGRWAQNQGKKRTQGHKEGAKIVRDVTQWCASQHIPFLTLYAFSLLFLSFIRSDSINHKVA
ncbi:undecaprenyl diphosphate synthase family protein, partial [Helicobacter japonicus]|uniref:undecaprenyl diphosphate synthase family protein n=1 Tax=Helicobacter japonicus TaxID=425400 RepID=UPI0026ED7E53